MEELINNLKNLDGVELYLYWVGYLKEHKGEELYLYWVVRVPEELKKKLFDVCKRYVFLLSYECLTMVLLAGTNKSVKGKRKYSSLSNKEKLIVYVHEIYKDSGDINIAEDIWKHQKDFTPEYIDSELRNVFGYTDDTLL